MNSYNSEQGLATSYGNKPKNGNEIAVSLNILKDSGLAVGDYIELSVNNKADTYLISGSYNTLSHMGYQIRMLNSQIEKGDTNYLYDEIFVNLKNSSDIQAFENAINEKYSYAGATEIEPLNKDMIETMPSLITPVTFLLITAFVIFALVIVFNIIIMNLRDNRRNFGIMKALGFTSKEIRNRYLYRILILTGLSSFIAVVLNLLFSKVLFKVVMGGLDVLIISPMVVIITVVAAFIFIILTVYICSNPIKNTKPNELIEE